MSDWKIEPATVGTVLNATGTAYEGLLSTVNNEESFTTIFAGLTWGSFATQCVSEALSTVLSEHQQTAISTIVNHIGAGMSGVGNATWQYQAGTEEMMQNFENEMLETAQDGDFSYFEQHGYQPE